MDHFEEKKLNKIVDFKLLKRLHKYTKPFYWILVISILAVFLSSAADLLRPYLTKVIIDDYVSGYKDEMLVSDKPFDSDYNIEFEGYNYIREKYYLELDTSPVILDTKQLLKTEESYLLVDGFIATQIGDTDFDLKTSGDNFTLTIKESSELYGNNNTYKGRLLTHEEYKVFRENDVSGIIKITIILLLTLVLAFAFSYIQTISLNYVGQKVIYNMREDLFNHIQHLSMSYYEKNPIGRLVTRVTNDMNNINEMYANVVVGFIKDFVILFGTMVIMVRMDWKLSLLCFSTLPIVIFVSFLFRKYIRAVQRVIKLKIAEINATLSENISGMKIIQLFNKEKHMGETFDDVNTDHLNAWLREVNIYAVFRPSMNLIYSMTLVLLIFFGGNNFLKGAVELGVMVAFITYIQQYFRPIFDLSEKFNIMQAAMASLERILMILDDDEKIENDPTILLDVPFKGDIEFEHVNFSYNSDEQILKDVSFKINAGETVAIVGATGSGKTTITSLIGRFYDIQSGCIKIDGHPIKETDLQFLRSQIAVVLQDVFLFAGSIRDNITLGEDMSDEQVKDVATFVNASHFIDKFDETYDYILTEKGSTLSAGQRQLLSFARALAFDPSILILDEATSNIDTETELLIQDAITKLIRNRTTIIIAHRLSTIQHANKIIVMHKGEICEMGTHQELLEHKGRYYDLYLLQYQDEQVS
ncbi:MAG: ABC transporter ATP-binding protein [Clostridiales bacterium]|nr:ABC transporter ATP-binding protein [Clostridiales bacterium]